MKILKSLLINAVLLLTLSAVGYGQLGTYTFVESTDAYSPLGGTNSTATGDDGIQNGIPIGFNFALGGGTYTHFCISTNGWIKLGNASTTIGASSWTNSLGNTATHRPLIAPLWDDGNRNAGAITYSTTGSAPNRVLTVDWNNVNTGGGGSTSATNLVSFQLRIYETTNIVEFVYGGTLATAGALSASIGLNDMTSFMSVTPGAPSTSSTSTANNSISSLSNVQGKKYTFSPPPPASLDMQALSLVSPAAAGCYGSAEPVTVQVKNNGSASIDFAVNPTTVTTNVTGAATVTLSATLTSGTLAAGATQNVTMTSPLDMSAPGTYTFNSSTSVAGDGNTSNDAMPAENRTTSAVTALPYEQNFGTGTTFPAGWTNGPGTWSVIATHGNTGSGLAKNMWSSATSGRFDVFKLGTVTATTVLSFDYRIVDFDLYPATATPNTPAWGNFKVQVSGDCGSSFVDLDTIDPTNHVSSLSWATKSYSLAAFAGQNIIVRVVSTWADGDYYIDIDNLSVAAPNPGVVQFSAANFSGNEGTSVTVEVARVAGSSGAISVDFATSDVTATGGALCGSADYVSTNGTLSWLDGDTLPKSFTVQLCSDVIVDPGESLGLTLSNTTGGATIGANNPATLSITDIPPPLNGTYTVGTGGTYSSLTGVGGIFEALNVSGAAGNVVIEIISDLTGETGNVALNEIAGGFSVLIKPSGGPRTISGGNPVALFKLNGADNVRFDGSTTASFVGGNATLRQLTVQNTVGGAIFWIATNATSGATNNRIENIKMVGPGAFAGQGIMAGSGATFGAAAENGRPNSNNTIRNNTAIGVQNAVFVAGDPTTLDENWVISENDFGSVVVAEKLSFRGIFVQNAQNIDINQNRIAGVNSSTVTSSTMSGIFVGGVINGGRIVRNEIKDIRQNNTTGWGSNGISLNSTSPTTNLVVANNMISDIASFGFDGFDQADNGNGIFVNAGAGYGIYFNTIVMNANQTATTGHSACLSIESGLPAGAVDVQNNIFVNSQTVGNRYLIINQSADTAAYLALNFNDYFTSTGANVIRQNTTNYATLAAWKLAVPAFDVSSLDVDPQFVSLTDFHLSPASPVRNVGTPIASVTDDFDGNPRPNPLDSFAVQVDMGGDEFFAPTSAGVELSGRLMTTFGQGIRNVTVKIEGGNLTEPITTRTGSMGFYRFEGLRAGETYVVTVKGRRYVFPVYSRVVTLNDNATDIDFVGDVLE